MQIAKRAYNNKYRFRTRVLAEGLRGKPHEGNNMALRRRFDYGAFVAGYRAACEQWGIDPAEGANGYQVVHVLAEQKRRQWQAGDENGRRWWLRHELWLNDAPYRSKTEHDAIWRLFVQGCWLTIRALFEIPVVRRVGRDFSPHPQPLHPKSRDAWERGE